MSGWTAIGADSGLPVGLAYPDTIPPGCSVGVSTTELFDPSTDRYSLALTTAGSGTIAVRSSLCLLSGWKSFVCEAAVKASVGNIGSVAVDVVYYDAANAEIVGAAQTIYSVNPPHNAWDSNAGLWTLLGPPTGGGAFSFAFRYSLTGANSGGTAWFREVRIGKFGVGLGKPGGAWSPQWISLDRI